MSYTKMFKIAPDGTWDEAGHYQNSHGFAAFIWTALVERYNLTEAMWRADESFEKEPMDFGMFGSWRYVWHQHSKGALDLSAFEHNVLTATYDRYMVQAEDFEKFATSLEEFEKRHGRDNRICHLKAMAEDVRKLIGTDAIGVCWYPMSVSENYWTTYNEETDESIPYNFVQEENHHVADLR